MSSAGKLIKTIKALGQLLEEEAAQNPQFAAALEAIVQEFPSKAAGSKRALKSKAADVPDVFAEFEARGEAEFSFWLRPMPMAQLKAIVKVNGFDPEKNSSRWTDPGKFMDLIVNQTAARLKRGSSFLETKNP